MSAFLKRMKFLQKRKKFLFAIILMFFLSIFLTVIETVGIASITSLVAILSSADNYIFDFFKNKEIDIKFNYILFIVFIIFFAKKTLSKLFIIFYKRN